MERSVSLLIEVSHLTRRYGARTAVEDLSFTVGDGQIYGLLGPNGAGKSTVMNILAGYLAPTDGTVTVCGHPLPEEAGAARACVGYLPETPPLYPEMTVEEYLTHTAEIRRVPDERVPAAVDEVLEICSIAHFRKRLIKNLSGGYQQRVGIAQAIIHKPEIVIFDEPTNGLDPTQIVEIRQLIKNIAQDRTVILSTHILSEVQAICDHILMVEQGQLVFIGKMEDFNNYIVPSSMIVTLADAPATEELEAIPGVCGVEELGGRQFRIHFDDAEEVAERLVDLSTARHWQLTEMRQEKTSLDTIFAVLSKKVQK